MKIPLDPARLSPIIASVYSLWCRSIRYQDDGRSEAIMELHRGGRPMIIALWHSELFALTGWGARIKLPLATVVSQSKDGEVIARVLEHIGHATARGSSSRGGMRALMGVKRLMEREGRAGVLTMDGPRGPRHKVKDGIIYLARRTGGYIVPSRAFPNGKYVFEKSWDRFELPWPLTRCEVRLGEPYQVPEEELSEEYLARERAVLEAKMAALETK